MNSLEFPYRLYLVISEKDCDGKDVLKVIESAIKGGVDLVQLREKNGGTQEILHKALRIQEVLSRYNVPLIINDHLEIAQKVNAYGIHVGNADIAPTLIRTQWEGCRSLGYSIEYKEQLFNEQTATADYLGVSPVFKTATKDDTVTEWGLEGIVTIRSLTAKPLVAIGNINASNAYQVIKAGADCLAVVSAICKADHPETAAAQIRSEIEKAL